MASEDDNREREPGGDGAGDGSSSESPQGGSHEKLARQMEKEADELEQRGEEVGQEISDTRDDWERKQASEDVPGAVGDPDRSDSSSSSEQSEATENEGEDSGR